MLDSVWVRYAIVHNVTSYKERLTMRALIFLVAIVLLLALAGWVTFTKEAGRSSINIETEQIEQDTDRALESGSNLLRKAGDAVDQANEPDTQAAPVQTQPAE
jgi:hypothetical protein